MLQLAYQYKEKLQEKYVKTLLDPKYRFFHSYSWRNYEYKIDDSSWSSVEMVSVDSKDNVIGLLSATLKRDDDKVSNLAAMNFGNLNALFSRDFGRFIHLLFYNMSFRKIEFNVVVGNPAEKIYDKYISKYGGQIVGIRTASVKLDDGQYYDEKLYEILKENWRNVKC